MQATIAQTISLDALQAVALFLGVIVVIGVAIGLIFFFASRASRYRDDLHKKTLEDLKKDLVKILREKEEGKDEN